MTNSRARATAATILVVAAVVAASSAWALAGQTTPSHSRDSSLSTTANATASGPRTDGPDAERRGAQRAEPAQAPRPVVPKRVRIPALGVDAPVVATGVTRAGNAAIPADGDVVGWYEYGSAAGAPRGSTVLIGHRDTTAEGPGALFDLDLVAVGDDITVAAGTRALTYRVTAVRSVEKAGLPASLFRRGGPPRLVVITCGGAFLPDAGGYQENLFTIAVPVKS